MFLETNPRKVKIIRLLNVKDIFWGALINQRALITSIHEDGQFYELGIRPGDRILEINRASSGVIDNTSLIDKFRSGAAATFVIEKNNYNCQKGICVSHDPYDVDTNILFLAFMAKFDETDFAWHLNIPRSQSRLFNICMFAGSYYLQNFLSDVFMKVAEDPYGILFTDYEIHSSEDLTEYLEENIKHFTMASVAIDF